MMLQVKGDMDINKLIILFVFDKMESALSEATLVDICSSSNNWINYMDCLNLLEKMVDDGFICEVDSQDEKVYAITSDGRECLASFYIKINKSMREEISRFVKKYGMKFKNRQECRSDYYLNKDGSYTVYLKIMASVQPTLELKFVVPDKKTAQSIYKKWDDKAAELYYVIYDTLVD